MTEALEETAGVPSDAALIAAVRSGDTAAYGLLYERHLGAARRAATSLAGTAAEREDLVAEAFTRVLRVVRNGRGPSEEFRPYLLVTMRNAAINANRAGVDVMLYGGVPDERRLSPRNDPTSDRLHAEVAANAFASLPERWRTVLWHTEIEGDSPAEVAPMLGLTPNSAAALAYRAREGLRQAYLQQYLPSVDRRECRAVATQLAGWVRRGIAAPKRRRITAHLNGCADCRRLANRLSRINDELRGIIGPVVLGAPFALAYLTPAAGSLATSGGVLAGAVVQTSVGYVSAMKAVVAGTALATAAAVTTVLPPPPASVPDRPSVSAPVAERPRPERTPTTGSDRPDRSAGTGEAPPAGPTESTGPSAPESTSATPDPEAPAQAGTNQEDRAAAKEQRQADKAAEKAARAEAKAARKAARNNPPVEPGEEIE
ncbi:MAG TPA: sigma-70 family RNA polymerase sigma factor [Actinophytocola sp.]|uniref:sigma-70 family RNA polymerase sigma factor n=1 Tax=Actinophytocola sp. TaxID=1872138 RepID=UPI002DBCE5C7|nr:sigma-70 family RNA polymerase sigma factor [Actinophytocola sp.]HEU5472902.1 sigma-70 family RNA polymerase sigma factor [Actinophytocola sp.]